ncbi:DMT family transporter [Clostridium saccharoperbutylacetonicum]|uniref:DMT family transporter n=1 Tax=Clostridium saccharoperbutylacetonicum TaxID=36745 RepID=UPI0039E80ED8
MYNLLSLLIGILISIMIAFNGKLSNGIGSYTSLLIIHAIGFFAIVIFLYFKKIKISFRNNIPLYFYIAGGISVFTVMFNNLSYSALGVSLPVALGLLGQLITSLAFDHYGFLGMPKVSFNKKKFIGLLFIIIGISIMAFN